MKVEVNSTSGCRKQVSVELPVERVNEAFLKTAGLFSRSVSVPGFRPGKAPVNIVRVRYGKEIRDEVVRTLVPQVVRDVLVENNLAPVGEPTVEDLTVNEGQPMTVKFEVEVLPEFELGEYRGLEVVKKVDSVTDEQVEEMLTRMRISQASLEPVEEARPAADGDFAEFELSGWVLADGADAPAEDAKAEIENHTEVLHLGDPETLPDFTENLRGMSVGDKREFVVTFPEAHGQRHLAGKRLYCKTELLSLRVRELPELDDAFAQGLGGDFEGLEDLRSKIRARLEKDAERRSAEHLEDALLSQLVERTKIEVPDSMVKAQLRERLQSLINALQRFGQGAGDFDWKTAAESQNALAVGDVQRALIVSKIADLENIEVGNHEIQHEIEHLAHHSGEHPRDVRARLTKDGGLDRMRHVIRNKKALQFLVDNARVTTETATPSEVQPAPSDAEAAGS